MDNSSHLEGPSQQEPLTSTDNIVVKNRFDVKTRKTFFGFASILIFFTLSIPLAFPLALFMESPYFIVVGIFATGVMFLGTLLVALLGIGIRKNRNELTLKEFLKSHLYLGHPIERKKFYYIFGAILGLVLFAILQLLVPVFYNLFGIVLESSDTSNSIGELTGVIGVLTMVFAVPFIVPFLEELFFRGFVLGFIADGSISDRRPKLAAAVAIIYSSIFFGIAHFQGATLLGFIIVGWITLVAVIKSFLFLKTKSIWPGVLVHVVYNGITVLSIAGLLIFGG